VANLPRSITIPAMKIFYKMGISPLGPYQYKMIAEDFEFDTSKIKKELNWKPTKTNADMLLEAYEYYKKNRKEIECRKDVFRPQAKRKNGRDPGF
jgi:UDP-glucose 4-epimerase